MKQFAQCTNCKQWYVRNATSPVEIYQDDHLHCITTWCVRCIDEAEQRSGDAQLAPHPSATLARVACQGEHLLTEAFQQFIEEHLHLMDRALQDDEEVLVPLIKDFIERAALYQAHLESSAQRQRLHGHLRYWEAFLKALSTHE